jgi:hypothetical protein
MTILLSTESDPVVAVACVIAACCPFERMRDGIITASFREGCALDAHREIDHRPDVTPRI